MHSHHSKGLLAGNRPLYLALPSMGLMGTILVLLTLTLFHLWLAAYLPPADDELYYWTWAQTLQSSYFDHPPMTAYFIWASTALFGDSVLAIRLPAVAIGLIISVLLLLLAPRGNLVWCMLFCPLAFIGTVLMTPDLPLVLFWLLYTVWFAWINGTLDGWNTDPVTRVYQNSPVSYLQWILGGVLLGFGGLSKYTMALAVPCGLVVLATRTRFRAWGAGYTLHLIVAGVLCLPILIFNSRYAYQPLLFQWHHSMAPAIFSFSRLFSYIGGQILLVGALPFLLFPWIALRHRDLCADARSQAYFCFFVLPFAFFIWKAFSQPLEANWPIVTYLTFFPVADRLLSWSSFRGIVRGVVVASFAIPWFASAAFLVHSIKPLTKLAPQNDRIAVLRGQMETARAVVDEVRARGIQSTLWLPSYQWTSYYRFLKIPSDQLIPSGRHSQFTLANSRNTCDLVQGNELFALDTSNASPGALGCFPHREVLKEFIVTARGQEVGRVWLSRYTK